MHSISYMQSQTCLFFKIPNKENYMLTDFMEANAVLMLKHTKKL